jgi:hypothetical protein
MRHYVDPLPTARSSATARFFVARPRCRPFPAFFLYYSSRRQQPATLSALIQTYRL